MALIAQARAEHGPRLFPVLAVIHTGTEMPGDIQGSTAGEHAGLTACAAVQINDHGQTGRGAGGAGLSSRKEGSADSIRLLTGVKSPMQLTDAGNGHKVTVSFDESVFSNGVLWQQDAESFVCMEPWNGWANSVNEAGHHIELNPGESKEFKWSVTIG